MPIWLGIFGFLLASAVAVVLLFLFRPEVLSGLLGTSEPVTGVTQAQPSDQVEVMRDIIDQLKYLLGGLALGLTGIVLIQTVFQARHDRVQHQGVEQVSSVMGVVQQTLESRLNAEKRARREATAAKTELASLKDSLEPIARRLAQQDRMIERERTDIEDKAERLATNTARHEFRSKFKQLADLARQLDAFKTQFEPLEEPRKEFSARVRYIRGIAAMYDNDPERVIKYLTEVTQLGADGEPANRANRRVANAYYYLGVTHANFNHPADAVDSFSEAIGLSGDGDDYLTRTVFAEALATYGHAAARVAPGVVDPTAIVADIDREYEGQAMPANIRNLRSRAILVQANTAILMGTPTYTMTVVDLLRPLLTTNPDYYYAAVTLAQTLAQEGSPDAAEIFRHAYETIRRSDNLHTLTESRSKILLQMAAAICLRSGNNDTRHAGDLLDLASSGLQGLPQLGSETCTVFSVLTKRNEPAATIRQHISDIRDGRVLLPGRRVSS
jgi:tetratricopeptide (TPR) repeat protein